MLTGQFSSHSIQVLDSLSFTQSIAAVTPAVYDSSSYNNLLPAIEDKVAFADIVTDLHAISTVIKYKENPF